MYINAYYQKVYHQRDLAYLPIGLTISLCIKRTNFKNVIYSNRHTRKAVSMVMHNVQLVVKPWKEDISTSTEKMTVSTELLPAHIVVGKFVKAT